MKQHDAFGFYKKIIFYANDNDQEMTRELNPYKVKAFYTSIDIYGDNYGTSSDYLDIEIKGLILCNNNPQHINAKKRKNTIFIVLEAGTIEGVLYVPFNQVKTHEIEEQKEDYQGRGCVRVSYNDKITFFNSVKVFVRDNRAYFTKGDTPTPQNVRYDVESIEEKLNDLETKKPYFDNEERQRARAKLKALYQSKIKEGFAYIVYEFGYKWTEANYITFYNCVDHYEKSQEYIKLERLTKDLQAINERWSESDTSQLLKRYKLTKKRTTKKGE